MKVIAVIFLFSVMFFGCASEGTENVPDQSFSDLVAEQDYLISHLKLQPYDRDKDSFIRSESFDTYFEPIGVFEFSDSVLIGNASSLSVSESGNMVVADRNAKEVFWFDALGEYVAELDPDSCHPGFSWNPMSASFSSNESVMVTINGPIAGFEFGTNGSCVGQIDLSSGNPDGVAVLDNKVYVYYVSSEEWSIYSVDSSDEKQTVISGTDFVVYNSRSRGSTSDLYAIGEDHLALIQRQSPFVKLINPVDGSVTQLGGMPDYYRPVVEDMKPGFSGIEELMAEMSRVAKDKSNTIGMHILNSEFILLQYSLGYEPFSTSEKSYAFQIVNIDGTITNKESIFFKGYMSGTWAASQGLLFQVSSLYDMGPGSMDKNNPVIVYRFRPQTH